MTEIPKYVKFPGRDTVYIDSTKIYKVENLKSAKWERYGIFIIDRTGKELKVADSFGYIEPATEQEYNLQEGINVNLIETLIL